jgi:hypothetical protein
MFLLNSRLGQFRATRFYGHPFSLSYGVNLPSSLTRVISITLGHLPLPTRVGLRYGRYRFNDSEGFLDGKRSVESHWVSPQLPPSLSLATRVDLPAPVLPKLRNAPCPMGTLNLPGRVTPLSPRQRYRNINLLSIAYASRPRLRPD